MDQWLDSLSEDWVSQPRSPHSSFLQYSSILRHSPSPTSNGSQSRIPRYKLRSASNLSTASGERPGQINSIRTSNSNEPALREKTASNLNASHKRLPNGQVKPQSLNPASMRLRGRHSSSGSLAPGLQDTVQHKPSPVKEKDAQGTPEWKRGVLKENAGGDLFSPIGLESVFKPPTVKSGRNGKPTAKTKLFPIEDISLSPPPIPSTALHEPSASHADSKEPRAASSPQSELHEEGKFLESLTPQNDVHSPSESPTKRDNGGRTGSSARSSDIVASSITSPCESPVLPTAHHHYPTSALDRSSIAANSDGVEDSGISSTQDKSRNENISPLYVSRHNTVDGRV